MEGGRKGERERDRQRERERNRVGKERRTKSEKNAREKKEGRGKTYLIPAAFAALRPTIESSITTHLFQYYERK